MSRPRPWLYALSGAVASAAVIGVIAYTTNALSGPDDGRNGLGAGGDSRPRAPVSTATATDSARPVLALLALDVTPAATTGAKAYAVYYVGANAAGKPVLYREWHRGPDLPAADPAGNGGDVLTEAVHDAMATSPARPRLPHALARRRDARPRGVRVDRGRHTLQIALKDTGIADRPTSMTAAEARAAVQQLVYTAQAAIGKRAPVVFTVGRKAARSAPRCSASTSPEPIANAPLLRTLSLVDISSPNEGDQVSGKMTVTGTNNSFEGTSVVYLERNGKKYLVTPTHRRAGRPAAATRGPSRSTDQGAAGRVHPRRGERRPVGPGPPRQRHPHDRGQVAQRPVRDSSAATATTPAVEVRSTSSPRRTACAPAAANAVDLVVGQPTLGPDDHDDRARRPAPTSDGEARRRRPRGARPPGRPTPTQRARRPRSSPSARRGGTRPAATASRPRGQWCASGPATSRPARRARRRPTGTRPTGRRVATPISVRTSTASSPRSPLGRACTTVTRGRGSGTVATSTDLDGRAVASRSRGPRP